jgi:hypothetical protein
VAGRQSVAQIGTNLRSGCADDYLFGKQIGVRIPKDWADNIDANLRRSQRVTTKRVLSIDAMIDAVSSR